ncbi:hypothetical protein OPQ81_010197 [Rhizoctonia solani]|nr:hypothetical protein OPQ81_010197 [Rhizoctonia solani]
MLVRLARTRLVTPIRLYSTEIAKQPESSLPQAPNRDKPWSTSQRPRPGPEYGARFEQTDMSLQPSPLSAQALIEQEPIRIVQGRKAVCDGGGGPLGHPKIFINLDKPGPRACGYWYVCILVLGCAWIDFLSSSGIRFEQAPHHGHEH